MISAENRRRAQDMRRFATPAERALWHGLRRRTLGAYVRRQFPLGPYILDFHCHGARLVVEVDGETRAVAGADSRRDAWLAKRGLKLWRFWNSEVLENLEGVLQVIAAAIERATSINPLVGGSPRPTPSPAPRGRGHTIASLLPDREGAGEGRRDRTQDATA